MGRRHHDWSVLVVDDFATMRKTMRDSLKVMGYNNVNLAADGAEAAKRLDADPVDLIISDWNMPNMDGLQLLRHVRQTPKLRAIPFMMVTAEGDREAVRSAIDEGVTQFLIKPFTQAALKERVDRMSLQLARARGAYPPEPVIPGKVLDPPRFASWTDGASVLVVDDVPSNIDVISGVLRRSYHVKAATTGEKALQIARMEPQPDLILLDIMMPDMDGFEVCRQLKAHPETEHLPVIFLSAKSETTDMVAGFEAGGVDYLVKPVDPSILEARAATHVRLKRSRDDLRDHIDTLLENARLREDVERITRHDIKSPLAAIVSASDILLDGGTLNGGSREHLETIQQSAYDALGMVNRSLDLYKMETGTYPVRNDKIDVVDVVNSAVKETRLHAHREKKIILLDVPDAAFAMGEPMLCLSMLRNLLKNAVEASSQGGKVRVTVTAGSTTSQITVHNAGVIPESIHDTFFDKYATAGKPGGTGLGTYSARLMARVQGGDISYSTSKTDGTTLCVELPAYNEGPRAGG